MNSTISSTIPVSLSDAPLLASLLISRVCAGFPSPAEDLGAQRIDLTQVLIVHPQAKRALLVDGVVLDSPQVRALLDTLKAQFSALEVDQFLVLPAGMRPASLYWLFMPMAIEAPQPTRARLQ